jgi:hypothetical protein
MTYKRINEYLIFIFETKYRKNQNKSQFRQMKFKTLDINNLK